MTDSSPRRVHRVWLAFVLGVAAGVMLCVSISFMGAGSSGARVGALVDARLPLRSEGLVVPFTLGKASTVTFDVHLPAMLESDVTVGPLYVALRPHPVLEPDAHEDRVHAINGCQTAPFQEHFKKPGAYALRIPPIPTAMGMESEMFAVVKITVTTDPD